MQGLRNLRLAMMIAIAIQSGVAEASTLDKTPVFHFENIDKREEWLRSTVAHLTGQPGLSVSASNADKAELDRIRKDEATRRRRRGGHLSPEDLKVLNSKLTGLARRLGLLEPGMN